VIETAASGRDMPRLQGDRIRTGNALLDALPDEDRRRLRNHLRRVPLHVRETLLHAESPFASAYFPVSGLLSLITLTRSGRTVEASQVGREGMIGLPAFLGVDRMPLEVVVQVPGKALSMSVADLKRLAKDESAFSTVLKRYTYSRIVETAQTAACNRLHSLEQRTARWLLEAAERVGHSEFVITHELMATLLGVQRPRVSEAIAKLQSEGLVYSPRERIRLTDTARLGNTACECLGVVLDEMRAITPRGGAAATPTARDASAPA
jgi:CRP-like cAMP-binding protein